MVLVGIWVYANVLQFNSLQIIKRMGLQQANIHLFFFNLKQFSLVITMFVQRSIMEEVFLVSDFD